MPSQLRRSWSFAAPVSIRLWWVFTHVFPVLALLASSAVAADKPIPANRVDDKDAVAVRELFTKFGETLADWRQHPEELLDTEELRALRAPGIEPKWVDAKDQGRVVMANMIHDWVKGWRGYDWAKTDIRQLSKRADGQAVEVIVWHLTKAGGREKICWTVKPTADGWRIVGWEDMRTGLTAGDLWLSAAYQSAKTERARQQTVLTWADSVHAELARGEVEEATRTFHQLAAVKWTPALRYGVDVAEARVALAEETPRFGGLYVNTRGVLALEIAEELVKKTPGRLAGHLLLAEAWLASNGAEDAVKACDRYLKLAGDDPDAFALRAAARLLLEKDDLAAADFAKALALDPYQPRAVRWKWETADAAGRLKMAGLLATAPDPTTLYRALTTDAEQYENGKEHDWAALAALGEEYRKVRPKDIRGVELLAEAYARSKRAADAGKLLADSLPKLHPDARPEVVARFVRAMGDSGQLAAAYALVPKAQARLAFREAARCIRTSRLEDEDTKDLRTTKMKPLKALVAAHTKADPNDPWLAVIDGRVKNAEREYALAAEVLAAALKKPPFNDPAETYPLSQFDTLRRELIEARYHTGRGVDAYRELPVDEGTFNHLATLYESDSDTAGLTALIEARTKREGDVPDTIYWRGEVHRLAGKHAEAAKDYRKYLAGETTNNFRQYAHEQLIRSLVKAGDGAAALKQSEFDYPLSIPHLLALHAAGKSAEAEKLLREYAEGSIPPHTRPLYADPDLGPVLKTDPAFAAFRKDFPPPAEK